MIGKSKKLIVPVIAIMMCAFALAGVAYAYTTSVSDTGSGDATYTVIDLYDDASAQTLHTGTYTLDDLVKVYTTRNVASNTGKLFVVSNDNAALTYVAVHKDGQISTQHAITMEVTGEGISNNVLTKSITVGETAFNVVVTFTCTDANTDGVYVVAYTVSTTASGEGVDFTGSAKAAAEIVSTALAGVSFTMTFTATAYA